VRSMISELESSVIVIGLGLGFALFWYEEWWKTRRMR
jgi:hypothetical protein